MTGSPPPRQPAQPEEPEEPIEPIEPIGAEILDAELVDPEPPKPPASDYDERGVPSFDYVRDKIESRFATALGSTELADDLPSAKSLDEQQAERDRAAEARLDEIRRNLRG